MSGGLFCRYVAPRQPLQQGSLPPLLVLLHGTGADEEDLLPLAVQVAPPGAAICSLRGPKPIGPGWRWFEGMSVAPERAAIESSIAESSGKILGFLEAAPETYGVDPRRMFLFGFSQGATMAYTSLVRQWPAPSLIAGAVLCSGRLLPHLQHPPLSALLAPPAQTQRVPLLITHGTYDSITPVSFARESQALASELLAEADISYREYDGDHEPCGLQDIQAWLAQRQ